MSDMYREILVKRKTPAVNVMLKGVITTMTVLCVVGGIIFTPLLWIGAIGFGLLMYFVAPKLDVEYEYLYVNGELDIDAIYSKQKRKKVGSYDVAEMELLAPANSHALDSFRNNSNIKTLDYTSRDPQVKSYIGVFNQDKGQVMVKVELDDAIIADIRRMAPRKVNLV